MGLIELGLSEVVSAVVALHHPCGPSAIVGTIRPIIVDAIQRQRGGGFPTHVGQEGLIAGPPSLAHHDAAPAIVLEIAPSPVITPTLRVTPGHEFGCETTANRIPMRHVAAGGDIAPPTPATAGIAIF